MDELVLARFGGVLRQAGLGSVGLGLALIVACGGNDSSSAQGSGGAAGGEPLDCSWVTSDNCWETTVAAAPTCLPPEMVNGLLSADGTSCTFDNGTTITFKRPIVLPLPEGIPDWDFTITTGGRDCLSYSSQQTPLVRALTVQGMTFSEKAIGAGLQITCPDGKKYATQYAHELLGCSDPLYLPGNVWASGDTSFSLELFTGTGDTLTLFNCAR